MKYKFRNWDERIKKWIAPTYPLSFYDAKGVVSQQHTGDTDSNGREVFVGDILEERYAGDSVVRGVVDFKNSGFYVSYCWSERKSVYSGHYLIHKRVGKHNYDAVIVGNIFDTPELIEYDALPAPSKDVRTDWNPERFRV